MTAWSRIVVSETNASVILSDLVFKYILLVLRTLPVVHNNNVCVCE